MRIFPHSVLLAAALGALALAARPAGAQDSTAATQAPPARATLASALVFVVVDSGGVPVPYAQVVEMPGERLRGVANASGEIVAGRWPLGRYELVVRRVGWMPRAFTLRLDEPDSVRVRVVLDASAQQMRTVVAAASRHRLADFERRRALGVGVFYDRAELERRRPSLVSDVLRTTPGLVYARDGTGTARLLGRDVDFRGGCPVEFYLDNVPIGDNLSADRMIDVLNIAAIEVYRGPSDVPAAFAGHRAKCGLVLIWTRIE